jgi:phosphoribosylanthranilate isomerase
VGQARQPAHPDGRLACLFRLNETEAVEPSNTPRIKICCIRTVEEAWTAIQAGAAALGLVSAMPSGPGVIPEEQIAAIAAAVPPPVATFLLTCLQEAAAIGAQQRRCRTNTIQLCDRLDPAARARLRAALPGVALVQVVHVTGAAALVEALAAAPSVAALLLDSGNPTLTVKELGGTGRVHDWSISRRIREASPVPVFLGGGLTPENVAEAVRQVRPFGVDVCTGVRTEGRLDPDKLARFIAAARAAEAGRPSHSSRIRSHLPRAGQQQSGDQGRQGQRE